MQSGLKLGREIASGLKTGNGLKLLRSTLPPGKRPNKPYEFKWGKLHTELKGTFCDNFGFGLQKPAVMAQNLQPNKNKQRRREADHEKQCSPLPDVVS